MKEFIALSFRPTFTFLVVVAGSVCFPLASGAAAQNSCTASRCRSEASDLLWFEENSRAEAVWSPFGVSHRGAKQLRNWIQTAKQGQKIPDFTNSLSLNCWEYVLYTGLRLGELDLEAVNALYRKRAAGEKLSENFGQPVGSARYIIRSSSVKVTWPREIEAGDAVFMDETSHVVQLLGSRDEIGRERVVSFSPRPIWGDGSQEVPVPNMRPEVTTVESLVEEMIRLYPDVPTDWQDIELKIVRPPAKKHK